jgi:hypothetical protein
MTEPSIPRQLRRLEDYLGLPEKFTDKLLHEDDWSFVIKTQALIEVSCTHALAAHFRNPDLAESLATLDMGNKKYGKIVLLQKLGVLDSDAAGALREFSTLRNMLAHDIRAVGFSFEDHLTRLDKHQKRNFVDAASAYVKDVLEIAGKKVDRRVFTLENPKFAWHITTTVILAIIHLEQETADVQREVDELRREAARRERPAGRSLESLLTAPSEPSKEEGA